MIGQEKIIHTQKILKLKSVLSQKITMVVTGKQYLWLSIFASKL